MADRHAKRYEEEILGGTRKSTHEKEEAAFVLPDTYKGVHEIDSKLPRGGSIRQAVYHLAGRRLKTM